MTVPDRPVGPVFPARPDPLRRWRHLAPERTALVDRRSGDRLTYPELDAGADRWTGLLRGLDLAPGDRVGYLAGNRREAVELFFACGRTGLALLPLNWRLAAPELAGILADARPSVIFGEGRFRAVAENAVDEGRTAVAPRWIDLDEEVPPMLRRSGRRTDSDAGSGGSRDREVDPHEAAMILYTSGSTGRPKGVIVPHRQVLYNAVATCTSWELGPEDVAVVSQPFFHTGGWNVFATPLWHRGGTVVLTDGFDADGMLSVMAEEGATVALVVPTQLRMLRDGAGWGREVPSLRSLFSGGAACPPSLLRETRDAGYPIREGYGLTECGPNCFAISPQEARARPGHVGRPIAFLEARLETEDGSEPPPGEPGELLLRGPQMFGGYFGRPEATRKALAPGGWLRTGDLARRDPDHGLYAICGRRKEMFISGGENVFPGEVEAALAGVPGVAEAVVVGVPDDRWGEVGRAFVEPEPGAAPDPELLREAARERLAGYKVPKEVAVLEELPRLGSGKPDREALAARGRRAREG